MFKITKGSVYGRYNVRGYAYIVETNLYIDLYKWDNIEEEYLVQLLLDRVIGEEHDIQWALDIARLTNCTAVIGDNGEIKAIPVQQRRTDHARKRESEKNYSTDRAARSVFQSKRSGTH